MQIPVAQGLLLRGSNATVPFPAMRRSLFLGVHCSRGPPEKQEVPGVSGAFTCQSPWMWLFETWLLGRALGRLGSLQFILYLHSCHQVWFIINVHSIAPDGGLPSGATKCFQQLLRLILMIIRTQKLLTSKAYRSKRGRVLQHAKTLKAPKKKWEKQDGSHEPESSHVFLDFLDHILDAALTMRFAKNTRHHTFEVLRLPRKMNMDASKVLRGQKNTTHVLNTSQKYCACHAKRFSTRDATRPHVTKCHACHAKRGEATLETAKNDALCSFSHRHGIATTTTNDERRRDETREANTGPTPRPPTINGNPSLRIQEKTLVGLNASFNGSMDICFGRWFLQHLQPFRQGHRCVKC